MPKDRYNFSKEFNIDETIDLDNLDTSFYDAIYEERVLSTEKDAKITARREARKARNIKESKTKVISEEDIKKAKKKQKKKVRTSRVIIGIAALIAVCAYVVVAGLNLTRLELEKRSAQKELEALQEKAAQLGDELQELDSDEYIENSARENLHMIKEGEVMYIVNPDLGSDNTSSGAK